MNQDSTRKARVNVRRAEVMEQVEKEIQQHYQSELISHIRSAGNVYNLGHTEFFLAREFGFCNGVRRAIDIAYAARKVFPDRRIFLIGDIIHNPEVNRQLETMVRECQPQVREVITLQPGCSICVHCGPGTVGVAYLAKPDGTQEGESL